MNITIGFIRENFDKFNNEYFGGELETPTFEITHAKSYLGQYEHTHDYRGRLKTSIIRISDKFDRTEIDVQNTIIHEMIHLYIHQNNIRDTRPHGRVFNRIADRINRQGGWHIARTNSIEGCGLLVKEEGRKWVVACFKDGKNRYFRFVINKNCVKKFLNKFDNHPDHFQNVFVFASTDDKTYAHYPECRSSVRGWFINKEEFESLQKTEKVVYCTLGVKHSAA